MSARPAGAVRIAAGQGFWGDWLEAPVRQVRGGPIDYLMMDYLAEVTMSIMQKQKSRDPTAGYARDFVPLMERILPDVVERGIRVTSNAGGVNPARVRRGGAGGRAAPRLPRRLRVGLVSGDDILDRLDDLLGARPRARRHGDRPPALRHSRPGALAPTPTSAWRRSSRRSAGGADVVVTGRVTDTGLTLGPIFHEFGWSPDDWDKVAAGTVAGHIIECGAQASGGNLLKGWRSGEGTGRSRAFPIVEASPDGSFVVTKHAGTGGVVSVASVTEQLVYEMGDPRSYITPDGVADFTTIQLRQAGRDRVRVSGIRGGPRTPMLKVSIAYFWGYKAVGTLVYAWPDAYDKAKAADRVLRRRLADLGLELRPDPHRVRRRGRDPRPPEWPTEPGPAGGAAPGRRARARARAGRPLHPGDRAAGAHRARRASPASPAAAPRSKRSSPTGPRSSIGARSSRTCASRSWRPDVPKSVKRRARPATRPRAAPLSRARPLGRQGQHRQRRPHRPRAGVL